MQDVPGPGGETLCARPARAQAPDPVAPWPASSPGAGAVGADRGPASTGPVTITAMTDEHAAAVLDIYQAGIDEGNATFETAAPGWPAFSAARLPGHRFVALGAAAEVRGWVAISATSGRPAYAGVVEHSVYVHPAARGLGIGRLLLGRLIGSTEAAGIWTIQSGIFPENTASVRLHLAAGFRVVGRRERIGQQHGRWRDILLLERRSPHL